MADHGAAMPPGATSPAGYSGIYINLDRSVERRRNVERQLAALGVADVYDRLPTIDGRTLPRVGTLHPGIVGCFHSHAAALALAAEAGMPVHIAEDDIVLTPHVGPFIHYAASRGLFAGLDIAFLDIWVDPKLALIKVYLDAFSNAGPLRPLDLARLSVIDLRQIRIGAMASYVIVPSEARKLHDLLAAELARGPTMPVDHYLSHLTGSGAITAAVVVPFLTGIDLEAGALSQTLTLGERHHRLFLLVRSAFFAERDLAGVVLPGLDRYRATGRYAGLDEISRLLARSAGISPG